MYNYKLIKEIEKIYKNNGNILENIKKINKAKYNTEEGIMISYDFQSGTYVENYKQNRAAAEVVWNDILNYLQRY